MRPRNLAAIAALAAVVLLLAQLLPSNSGGSIAFAQVQEQVAKAKTLQYTMTITSKPVAEDSQAKKAEAESSGDDKGKSQKQVPPPPRESTQINRVMVLGSDRMRTEIRQRRGIDVEAAAKEPARIEIQDYTTDSFLLLFPDRKQYIRHSSGAQSAKGDSKSDENAKAEPKQAAKRFTPDFYSWFQFDPKAARKLPEKVIDGKKMIGFEVEKTDDTSLGKETRKTTFWIDPETKQPVRIERHSNTFARGTARGTKQRPPICEYGTR